MTQIPAGKPLPKGFLKFQPNTDVEQAKADMIAAREPAKTFRGGTKVPSHIANAAPASQSSVTVEEIDADVAALEESEPQPQPVQPVRPTRIAAAPPPPQRPKPPATPQHPQQVQRIETDRFTAAIFRGSVKGISGNAWIAEVRYTPDASGTAAGTERFTAPNKEQLMLKLLQAKSNATLKIREMVQREKSGFKPDTWDSAIYDKLRESHNLTKAQFLQLPAASQSTIVDTLTADYAREFLAATPEYYPTDANFKALGDYLNKQKWPISLNNLTYAFQELSRQGKLETAPAAPQAPVAAAPLATPHTAAPTAAVQPTRKRAQGPSGIIPGASSSSAGSPSPRVGEAREPNEAELRSLPMSELRKRAIPSLNRGGRQ